VSNGGGAKFRFKVPDTYTLIFFFVIIAAILTYILPAGVYEMVKAEGLSRAVVDPSSYHGVESSPVGLMQFLLAIPLGMKKGATVIFMVMIVGGAFQIIRDTGSLDSLINLGIRKFKDRALLIIPLVMLLNTFLGAAGIMVNSAIAFVPIGVEIAKKLDLDPIVGMAIMYLGAYSGFITSPFIPSTLALAQEIAGVEIFSGFALRSVAWLCIFAATVLYTFRYASKVKKDKSRSVFSTFSENVEKAADEELDRFTLTHFLVVLTFATGFVLYAYGSQNWKWRMDHMSAILLAVGIIAGIIGRMSFDDISRSFIYGCKSMVYGALVIGFASAIIIVLTEGKVIHTIIYYLTLPLQQMGAMFSAVIMFWVNLVFNFFVPSGTGQAAVVMPLMGPMADILGFSRQVAVSAYQWGDGMSNTIIPTSGVLMACIGVAGIPYSKWFRWMLPLFGIWVGIGTIAIIIAVSIGWA
jgi:uncharacterized ion transporter superfamily protein YfcC